MSVKSAGLQRSRSDAGRDHQQAEYRKPPSGLAKPSAGTSFGYKKPPAVAMTGTAAVLTAGGATLTGSGGSSTLGKTTTTAASKSSGIPVKPAGAPSSRKNSFDASSSVEQHGFGPHSRNSIQYRSLPRPAKSSTLSLIGRPPGSSQRAPTTAAGDPQGLLGLKPHHVPMASTGPRMKDTCGGGGGGTKSAGRSSSISSSSSGPGVNQTDREKEKERAKAKAEASDLDDCCSLKSTSSGGGGESAGKLHGLRRSGSGKYPELSSPTTTPRSGHSAATGPCLVVHVQYIQDSLNATGTHYYYYDAWPHDNWLISFNSLLNLHLHLQLGHLADAFIQSDLQGVHLEKERQQYIAVLHKDKNRTRFEHS